MKKCLLLMVMVCIFYLSNTPGLQVANPETWFNEPRYEEEVTDLTFIKKTGGIFYTPYIKEDLHSPDFILHKLSHIFFYSLLTILLFINLRKTKTKYLLVWSIAILFAFTDEAHQYFVVGRSGRLYDVILDATASFLTLLLICLIRCCMSRKMQKQAKISSFTQLESK